MNGVDLFSGPQYESRREPWWRDTGQITELVEALIANGTIETLRDVTIVLHNPWRWSTEMKIISTGGTLGLQGSRIRDPRLSRGFVSSKKDTR